MEPSSSAVGRKRASDITVAQLQESTQPSKKVCDLEVSLYVRWKLPNGKSTLNHLQLKPLTDLESLEGASKSLINRAFSSEERPGHMTSEDFYQFTPSSEPYISSPGYIESTDYRLVAMHDGWEYTIIQGTQAGFDRRMLVTAIEFESTTLVFGHFGIRVSFMAYPVVSIRKDFLDSVQQELSSNPDFKGLMFDKQS